MLFNNVYLNVNHGQDSELLVAEGLLNRLAIIEAIISRIENHMGQRKPQTGDYIQPLLITYLYWHFLETQIIRRDLQLITMMTGASWRLPYEAEELAWQKCWNGNRDALALIRFALATDVGAEE